MCVSDNVVVVAADNVDLGAESEPVGWGVGVSDEDVRADLRLLSELFLVRARSGEL